MDSPGLLHHLLLEKSLLQPDEPAILAPGKQTLTYQNLSKHIQSVALHLNRLGVLPGDRVAVVLPNGPDMAIAFLAVSAVSTCAPLNPGYTEQDFKFSLEDLHVKLLITTPGVNPSRKAAIELGIPIIDLEPETQWAGAFKLVTDLPINETILEPIFSTPDETALVLHTSGTTSRPKIVPLTHRNIYYSTQNISETYQLTHTDRCLNMMPLFHIHGLIGSVASSLTAGASVICAPGFSSDEVMNWVLNLRPTWYTAVPTIHQAFLDQAARNPDITKSTHFRFIRSCSSPLSKKLAQDLEKIFDAPVLEAYGMTEATHQIASNPLPPDSHKYESVGLPTGTTRVAILDSHGIELNPNEIGEICIQGENVMTGYENNPEANANSFAHGWLRTGDHGFVDKEGYIFIKGRLKELINRGGEKISPREIDETLLKHPAVKQAVAFAFPHQLLGEDVAAAVVLKHGEILSMQELRQFVATRLADYKVPRIIVFISDIPKGPTGKIQRIGLAEKLKSELEAVIKHKDSGNIAPRTPIEAKLLTIWQQVMNLKTIGVEDDFLVLGGDSIMAAQIIMLVKNEFHVNLSIRDIFNAPTIELMASLIQKFQSETTQR
jgi:oxalate---CoA ligase